MNSLNTFNINDRFLTSNLSTKLLKRFGSNVPIIICLGSDKVLSDMVGIFVADKLKKLNIKTKVFGGSDFVITNKNLDILLKKIDNKNLLFIDSAISNKKNIIYFNNNGIRLKNNKFYSGASISASTVFFSSGKIQLANIAYKKVKNYADNIVLAITDYLSYIG